MRGLTAILFLVLCAILQVSVMQWCAFFHVRPDLLFIAMAWGAFHFPLRGALGYGMAAGIFKDVLSVTPGISNTFLLTLWSFCIAKLSQKISLENFWLQGLVVFLFVLIQAILMRVVAWYNNYYISLGIFLGTAFIEALYTAIAMIMLTQLSKRVFLRTYITK